MTSLVRSQSLDDLKDSTSKFLQAITDEKERKRTANEEEMEAILFEKDLIYKQVDISLLFINLRNVLFMLCIGNIRKEIWRLKRNCSLIN